MLFSVVAIAAQVEVLACDTVPSESCGCLFTTVTPGQKMSTTYKQSGVFFYKKSDNKRENYGEIRLHQLETTFFGRPVHGDDTIAIKLAPEQLQ